MIGPAPKCLDCSHFVEDEERLICRAFPSGIPEDIYMGTFDHVTPYPNTQNPTDGGLVFKKKEGK